MTRAEAIKYLEVMATDMVGCLASEANIHVVNHIQSRIESIDMAQAALREQEQREWISVKERLPDPFVSVLVYMPEERPLPTVHEGYVTHQGNWYAHFFEREPFEVTRWMPLPEPPKED